MDKKDKRINIFIYILLSILFVVTIFPIVFIVLASFKTTPEILASSSIFPKTFQFDNYVQAWKLSNFSQYMWNSIYMSFFIVMGTIAGSTMAGYVFSRGNFAGKKFLFALITSTMFIAAGSLYLYPQLQMAKMLHINNSLWGVIVINIFGVNVTQLYIAKSFVDSLPKEIDEAAKMDGCSFFRVFLRIIFPLTKPLIATIGLLSFMNSWNDYLLPMVFTLGKKSIQPLVVGIVSMKNQGEGVTSWNLMVAGTTMSVLPMLIVYLFLNKYFVAGLTSGAIKG